MPKAPKKVRLGKRILTVIEAAKHGEKLCKSIRQSEVGTEISWSLEPSGKTVGEQTAMKIVSSGLLNPSVAGLIPKLARAHAITKSESELLAQQLRSGAEVALDVAQNLDRA